MSTIVKETSEYVEMSDSITLCIVKDGADGTSINMKTGVNSPDALPSSGASVGDSYIIDGHLWTYTDGTASDATHHNGFTNCGKVSGEAGKNNYVHVAWSNKQNPTKDDIVLSNTDGNAYAYMGTWVSETKEDTADEAVNMAKWVYVKGDKGDTPTFAKLRVNHSALHYNPSTGKWDYDSVTVTIVIFTSKGTQIPDYGDTKEYYWLLDDDTTVKRSSGMGFSATLNAASHRATLYKDGSNVAIDTITVPMVRDGQDGQGADGKGALEIICDPETIVLDTDDNGLVKDTDADGQVTGNYDAFRAALMCVRDGKVVDNVTYNIGSTVNCKAKVNNVGVVTITKVNTQTVAIDGSTVTVSSTSGSVTVNVTEDATGVTYTKTVPFAVNVARYTGGLKADNKRLESKYTKLKGDVDNKFTAYDSKLEQTSERISSAVSKVDEVGKTVSEIKQTSNGISSTVTQIRSGQIGNNFFTGVTGIGWHGGVFDGAGGFYIPYTDYAFLPPIANFSDDYILSFGNWNANLQIEIYQTDDAYEINKLNYYCNFNGEKEIPILLVVEGNNNDTLNNTYLVTSPNADLASLKKDDIVVVQKHITSSNKDVYPKCKIKTIISDTTDSFQASKVEHRYLYKVTVQEFASTDDNFKTYNSYSPVSLVCSVCTNDTVIDGTALNTVNLDSNIQTRWIRFKGNGMAFLIRVKAIVPKTDIYFGSIMVEDATLMGEDIRPHRFSFESSALSSSIKQTATEIRQQVGDSFTSLKNGNFTIGANTKIIGNLNVTGTNNKISITNDDGTQITQIQPVSIGTWDNIKNRSTIELHLYRTESASFATDNYGKLDSAQSMYGNNYVFTNYFDVGTFNTGDSIQMNTSYGERIFDNGSTSHQNANSKYDLYKVVNGTVTTLMTWNNIASKNYIMTETALLRVKVTTTVALGSLNTFKPNSIVTLSWKVGLDAVVPDKGQLITTVGYDGIASSYGNGNYMMIGKDIAAFKYGNYEIQLSKDGIIGLSTKKVFRMSANASGMIYDNSLGAWKFVCGTNTIYNTFIGLNTRTPTYLYLPSSPYDGQEITVIDKCFGVNFYVVPTGGYKMCFDGTDSNSYYKDKHELPQNTMWHFIFSYDTWYAE